ncbi:hypothetical protein Amsp01_104960 [Amycolatopsis sp. NBRC 101858]|nr:hypothetical protein Amsp01_104960 [Amycolatopsis sp. NBRC 101858]
MHTFRATTMIFHDLLAGLAVRHGLTLLRINMGLVFLGFGVLKFFPGVSPAENLVAATSRELTWGVVPALVPFSVALAGTAALECVIGLSLVTGWLFHRVRYLLALELAGILSPVVLLPGRLFSGPGHAPTLEGQYVLKDIVLLAAAIVLVARASTTDSSTVPAVPAQRERRAPAAAPGRATDPVAAGFRTTRER